MHLGDQTERQRKAVMWTCAYLRASRRKRERSTTRCCATPSPEMPPAADNPYEPPKPAIYRTLPVHKQRRQLKLTADACHVFGGRVGQALPGRRTASFWYNLSNSLYLAIRASAEFASCLLCKACGPNVPSQHNHFVFDLALAPARAPRCDLILDVAVRWDCTANGGVYRPQFAAQHWRAVL